MATSTPLHCHITTSSMFNKPPKNPALQIFRASHNPTKSSSLKELCDQGSLNEAFNSFSALLYTNRSSPHLSLDSVYSPLLDLCAKKKALSEGQQLHTQLNKSWALWDSGFLSTKLVCMYGKCGSFLNAEKVFDEMSQRTIFTWNAMIGAYASNGEPWKALGVYSDMRVFGIVLDSFTFPCVLKACVAVNSLCYGAEVHGVAIKYGYDSVAFVQTTMIWKLFDGMKEKDDYVSWNSIISAYSAKGLSAKALALLQEMHKVGLTMNTYTFVAALQACEDSFSAKLGMGIHAAVMKLNYCFHIYVANSLLAMYVRCGKMDEAAIIFNDLGDKDIVSWNTLLSGFVQNGLHKEALLLFRDMQSIGQKPDQVSILNVIAASG